MHIKCKYAPRVHKILMRSHQKGPKANGLSRLTPRLTPRLEPAVKRTLTHLEFESTAGQHDVARALRVARGRG